MNMIIQQHGLAVYSIMQGLRDTMERKEEYDYH
jgi:hypothetical protein